MKPYRIVATSILLVVPFLAGPAGAQGKPACDPAKTRTPQGTPQRVEGKVVRIDEGAGRVAVTEPSGTTHEFQASKETLQDLKGGDTIEARLRQVPGC